MIRSASLQYKEGTFRLMDPTFTSVSPKITLRLSTFDSSQILRLQPHTQPRHCQYVKVERYPAGISARLPTRANGVELWLHRIWHHHVRTSMRITMSRCSVI